MRLVLEIIHFISVLHFSNIPLLLTIINIHNQSILLDKNIRRNHLNLHLKEILSIHINIHCNLMYLQQQCNLKIKTNNK